MGNANRMITKSPRPISLNHITVIAERTQHVRQPNKCLWWYLWISVNRCVPIYHWADYDTICNKDYPPFDCDGPHHLSYPSVAVNWGSSWQKIYEPKVGCGIWGTPTCLWECASRMTTQTPTLSAGSEETKLGTRLEENQLFPGTHSTEVETFLQSQLSTWWQQPKESFDFL